MSDIPPSLLDDPLTGDELSAWLKEAGLRKGVFARIIGYSNEQVSLWTNHYHDRPIPRAVSLACRWIGHQLNRKHTRKDG